MIWSGNPSEGTLPIDMQEGQIQSVLTEERRLLEDALARKAHEIVQRYTTLAHCNARLHRLDKTGGHPSELGDYDVLAFLQEKNIVLNIECKHLPLTFCMKDAKTLRETIFGKSGTDEGHFRQINKRQKYLEENIVKVAAGLNWPINPANPPTIKAVYVSQRMDWWMRFPVKQTNATFLRIEMLSKFIEDIS